MSYASSSIVVNDFFLRKRKSGDNEAHTNATYFLTLILLSVSEQTFSILSIFHGLATSLSFGHTSLGKRKRLVGSPHLSQRRKLVIDRDR